MLTYLILGFLRYGPPSHGYQLAAQHRAHTGKTVSPGNIYRELSKLLAKRLVRPAGEQPGADRRRIPYQITDYGRQLFDEWLLSLSKDTDELDAWLVFADRVPADVRDRVLDRIRDTLWSMGKAVERAREDAMVNLGQDPGRYHPLHVVLARRLKLVTAELEFLADLRAEGVFRGSPRAAAVETVAVAERKEPSKGAKRARPRGT